MILARWFFPWCVLFCCHVQAMGLELYGANGPGTCMSPSYQCSIGIGW